MSINKLNIGKQRKTYLDLAKLSAMFFVIWGHAAMQSSANHDDLVVLFVGSFHMPLFMMVSGMFAKKAMEKSFGKLIIQKFRHLIWPCLTFGVILFTIGCTFKGIFDIKSLLVIELTEYWFLRSLFLCFIISWFIHRLPENFIPIGCIISVLACCSLNFVGQTLFYLHTMLPFFYMGMLFIKYESFFQKHDKQIGILALLLFRVC
jgi:fucose 4-O-acetylase-like acetyltransferase